MQAVVITGPKKSGKTALLALVAEVLERKGKRVAVVKYSQHALEKGNTDAFWLMRPKRTVVNVSPEETAVLWSEQLPFEAITRHLDADVLLMEGGDAPCFVPRIVCMPEDADDAGFFARECGSLTVIAVYGDPVPGGVPNFPEIDPAAAERISEIVLEKGAVV